MPADRTKPPRPRRKPKSARDAQAGPSTGPTFKVQSLEQRDGLPGVNKIKGQIRQTKRLLSRDTLEPALRIQTQRRLTALEADLAAAERRGVEKKNGSKYHAVKFFERKKLVRIIRSNQRELEKAATEEGDVEVEVEEGSKKKDKKKGKDKSKSRGKEKKRLEDELEQARIMLNYVINYPNTKKYIALFPSASAESDGSEEKKLALPTYLAEVDVETLDKPSRRRREMLLETRTLMAEGKLSATPEVEGKAAADVVLGETGEADEGGKKGKKDAKADEDEEDDFFEDA